MKFLVSRDLNHSRLYVYLIASVVSVVILYLIMDAVLHAFMFGSDIQAVRDTLFGNMETFEEPILLDTLLLQVHIDLFMTIFALMILSSVYIRLHSKRKYMKITLHTLFLSGIFTPFCLVAAYFWHEVFVYLWAMGFILWHLMGLMLALRILKSLDFR